MIEIKFRGKRTDNGEWVEGYYLMAAGMSFISAFAVQEPILVDPDTVGQFTCLHDKNGKDIYEHDIVNNGHTIIYSQGNSRRFESVGDVRFDTKNGCFVINNTDGYNKRLTLKTIKLLSIEVIGNIHENNIKEIETND